MVDHNQTANKDVDKDVDQELTALAGAKGELIKVTIEFSVTY